LTFLLFNIVQGRIMTLTQQSAVPEPY